MEPVVVPRGVCAASAVAAAHDVVDGPPSPGPGPYVDRLGTRPPERLAVVTALGLAVAVSALSLGLTAGGSANGALADGRTMVAVWPPDRPGDEAPPTMGGAARHRGDAHPAPLPVLPGTLVPWEALSTPTMPLLLPSARSDGPGRPSERA
jgi:hypothetical protein